MKKCRGLIEGLTCAEEAVNTIHGYEVCDACAFDMLKSTPRRRDRPADENCAELSAALASWAATREGRQNRGNEGADAHK